MRIDRAWMPGGEGSLYLRPFMIASETFLGVKPSSEYIFAVIASPVGSYFKGGPAPVSIWVSENYTRASVGGTGAVKCGGNYAASLRAQAEAMQHSCDQVVFLDAIERRYVEELGGMNVFFVFDDGSISTPPLGTILPGITRDSIITLARDAGKTVREEPYSIEQWRKDAASGRLKEAFALRHGGRDFADRQGALGQRRLRDLGRRRRPGRHGPAQAARRHPIRPHQRSPQLDPQGVLIAYPPLEGRAIAYMSDLACGDPSRRPPLAGPQDEDRVRCAGFEAPVPLSLTLRDREAVVSKGEARAQVFQKATCDSPALRAG